MSFSESLKELRERRGLSQSGLAREMHIHPSDISRYESAEQEPNLSVLIKLADYFNVTMDYLVDRERKS